MDSVSRADIWRCLVGDGVSSARASAIVADEDVTLEQAFEAASAIDRTSAGAAVRVLLDDPTAQPIAAIARQLDSLTHEQRRAVLAHHVADVGPEDLVSVTSRDLETGEAILSAGWSTDPREATRSLLAPVIELPPPPELRTRRTGPRRAHAFAALGMAMLVGGWIFIAETVEPRPVAPASAEPTSPAPTATTATTELPSAALFVEPDREIEVHVSDDNTIVRQEPWTRRVIWESRPFRRGVEIVSVDPNTITVETAGNRLLVSLSDGTLLPP